jgi:hypothetical protein
MVGGMTRGEFFLAVVGALGAIGAIMKVGPGIGNSIENLRNSMKINMSAYKCAIVLLTNEPKVVTAFLAQIEATDEERKNFIKSVQDEKSKLREEEISRLRLTKQEEERVMKSIDKLKSMTDESGRRTATIVGEKVSQISDRAVNRRASGNARTESENDGNRPLTRALMLDRFIKADNEKNKRGKSL